MSNRKHKNIKLGQSGAALLNVLIITTFVLVLVSSILAMAMNSYRLKNISLNSTNNFYSSEGILNQLKSEFKNELEDSGIAGSTDAATFKNFYAQYEEAQPLFSTNESVSGTREGSYCYDISKLASLVTNINGYAVKDVKVTEGKRSGEDNLYSSSAEITFDVENGYTETVILSSEDNETNNFELTDSYVKFKNLTVDYIDKSGYESKITTDIIVTFPSVTTTVSSSNSLGWVSLGQERVKTLTDWDEYFKTHPEQDFGDVYLGDHLYIGTTDYPANTVNAVQFMLPYYYNKSDYRVQYAPVVQVQNGSGSGGQYQACSCLASPFNCTNVYIYVGTGNYTDYDGSEMTDAQLKALGWVRYDTVFTNTQPSDHWYSNRQFYGYLFKTDSDGTFTEEAIAFLKKYKCSSVHYDSYKDKDGNTLSVSEDFKDNPNIQYMVKLRDSNNSANSRGWISAIGVPLGNGDSISIDEANIRIFVNIKSGDEAYSDPVKYNPKFSDEYNFYNEKKTHWAEFYIDVSDCNYQVGDQLKVTLNNVDADRLMNNFYINDLYGRDPSVYGTHNGGFAGKYSLKKINDTTVEVLITMTWDMYPYIKLSYGGSINESIDADVTSSWIGASKKTGSTTTTTKTSNVAQISYENWRKE